MSASEMSASDDYEFALDASQTHVNHMISFGARLFEILSEVAKLIVDTEKQIPKEYLPRYEKCAIRLINIVQEMSDVTRETALDRTQLIIAFTRMIQEDYVLKVKDD